MGRASRRKRERRDNPVWRGLAAEARGRRTLPTVAGFELAVRRRSDAGLREGLFSRHNQRWGLVTSHAGELAERVLPVLTPVAPIVAACEAAGVDAERPPSMGYGGTWSDHIAWAVDEAIAATRLVLVGQAVGAAALARSQLERWTMNLAAEKKIELTLSDMEDQEKVSHIWGPQQRAGEDVQGMWRGLSELLHGRGPLLEVVRWEAVGLLTGSIPDEIDTITAAIRPSLRQVRAVALGMATDGDYGNAARLLRGWPEWEEIEWPIDLTPQVLGTVGVWPMLIDHVEDYDMLALVPASARFRAGCCTQASRGSSTFKPGASAPMAFANHRYRSWQAAGRAFASEQETAGELFDPRVLGGRAQQLVLVAEAATLAGLWREGQGGADGLWLAASALRSAFLLWLEDDDRAVACVRTALEATARARTWRTKPTKAAAMRSTAIARDWFEGAGWKRLRLVNRSLGELSHVSWDSKWSGARLALIHAIPDHEVAREEVARGALLRTAVALLAEESEHWLRMSSLLVSDAFRREVIEKNFIPAVGDSWLDQVWAARATEFGAPDFVRPTD